MIFGVLLIICFYLEFLYWLGSLEWSIFKLLKKVWTSRSQNRVHALITEERWFHPSTSTTHHRSTTPLHCIANTFVHFTQIHFEISRSHHCSCESTAMSLWRAVQHVTITSLYIAIWLHFHCTVMYVLDSVLHLKLEYFCISIFLYLFCFAVSFKRALRWWPSSRQMDHEGGSKKLMSCPGACGRPQASTHEG